MVHVLDTVLTDDPQALAKADPAPPCAMVIFGAGGDLTKRLLMPALYNLSCAGLLDEKFQLRGVDRAEGDDASFRQHQTEMMESFVRDRGGEFAPKALDEPKLAWLMQRLSYQSADFDDPATFKALGEWVGTRCAVFYLAVADRFFGPVIDRLAEAGLLHQDNGMFRRVVIEKPFGHDLASAEALNKRILKVLDERQIYRIDHFLGKETVQNIMALRFSNGIFEPIWNREHIEYVEITAAETIGVEQRAKFYEPTGALRDMVPNHMFQLLSMVAMEAPNSFDADAVRSEKAKVIEAIKPIGGGHVRDVVLVRGQYSGGKLRGEDVLAYRAEPGVDPHSTTETYIAVRFDIDNWRWAGVPFYIRTGKRMTIRKTEIVVHFRQAPYALFRDTPVDRLTPNVMTLHIQPTEGVSLQFSAKIPGPKVRLGGVTMDMKYSDYFKTVSATGYETLLYDVLIGDATLFQRADNIEAGWRAVQPILDAVTDGSLPVEEYEAGTAGPPDSEAMLARDGHRWARLVSLTMPEPDGVPAQVLVVMGVSGSGKTTIAVPLAERLGWPFMEGDDLHPPANVAKMHSGRPLDDDDRWPWLDAIATWIDQRLAGHEPGVITCSALKRAYRDRIIGARRGVRLVFLHADRALLAERLAHRTGHFMPSSLLDSQIATLEPPTPDEHPLSVDLGPPPEQVVEEIIAQLRDIGRDERGAP